MTIKRHFGLLIITALVVGCQPAQKDEPAQDTASTLEQVPETLDEDFVKLLRLMNAFDKDKIDIKKLQAEHERFAKEYNATGTIARSIPQSMDELLEFERINAFLSGVATPEMADGAIVYINNGEITQIVHRLSPKPTDPRQKVSISYYLIDGEPVMAKAADDRQEPPAIQFYQLTPNAATLVADRGDIDWQSVDERFDGCKVCYDEVYRLLDVMEQLKRQSIAQKQQSNLTNNFQSRNQGTITLENNKQLDDYPKNSLVVGHYPDGSVGQVFYSFGDHKSQTSYGYYFEDDKLISIDKTFIAYLPNGDIDQSSRVKKQWSIKDGEVFFSQNDEGLDLPAQKKQVRRLIDIAHQSRNN